MYREKRGKENIENVAERKENNVKRKGGKLKEKLKMEGGKVKKNRRGPFFIYMFFIFYFFAFHFSKRLKFVFRSTKMGIFYREKAFHQWRSQYRGKRGQSAPLDSEKIVKNREKERKNWEKIEKKSGLGKGQNREGSFTSNAPPDK